MARGRFISKRIGKSDKLAKLRHAHSRFLYVVCYTHADVEGRCTADPYSIYEDFLGHLMKKRYAPARIEIYLLDLAEVGLIVLYNDKKERRWMEFVDFHDHQIGLRKDREAPSFIPAPRYCTILNAHAAPESSGVLRTPPDISKDKDKDKVKRKRRKKEEEKLLIPPDGFTAEVEIQTIQDKWNEFAKKHDLAEIVEIDPKSTRMKHLKARMKKGFDIEIVLDVISKSPFLLGKTKAGFRVFFDWIILPSNFQKIIEGNYLDRQYSGLKSWLIEKQQQEKEKDEK